MLGVSDVLPRRVGRNEGTNGSLCQRHDRQESVTAGAGSSVAAREGSDLPGVS